MSGFASELLSDTVITVETTVLPPFTFNVREELEDKGPPGLATRILRPRVTVKRGNVVLYAAQPAGSPDVLRIDPTILLLGLATLLLMFVWK